MDCVASVFNRVICATTNSVLLADSQLFPTSCLSLWTATLCQMSCLMPEGLRMVGVSWCLPGLIIWGRHTVWSSSSLIGATITW